MKDILIKPNKTMQYVILGIIIVVIVTLAYQLYKTSKDAGTALGNKIGSKIIADQLGISEARQLVCREIAVDCNKAISRVYFVGSIFWVSDQPLVFALNRCVSSNEAIFVSQLFRELTGDSLKEIVEGGFVNDTTRKKITHRYSLT